MLILLLITMPYLPCQPRPDRVQVYLPDAYLPVTDQACKWDKLGGFLITLLRIRKVERLSCVLGLSYVRCSRLQRSKRSPLVTDACSRWNLLLIPGVDDTVLHLCT